MKNYKRFLSVVLAGVSALSMTGCGSSMLKDDPTSYPLVPELTANEVIEYYAESLSFDSNITKNLDVDTVIYETQPVDVDSEEFKKIATAVAYTQAVLNRMTYEFNEQTDISINEATFHYLKSLLNDKKLEGGQIRKAEQALGHYFVDVEYDVSSRSVGTFKPQSSLLGLNGAFVYSEYYDKDQIDTAYLSQAADKLNAYYKENRILNKQAKFDRSTGVFSTIINGEGPMLDFTESSLTDSGLNDEWQSIDSTISNPDMGMEGNPDEGTLGDAVTEDVVEQPVQQAPQTGNKAANYVGIRSPKVDITEFNTVVGSSLKTSAYMPKLEVVYDVPASEGVIGGIGIYPAGTGGLTKFGFDRSELKGTITLRFVYKQDLNDPSLLRNINVYPVFYEVTTGFASNNSSVVPEFLMTEFEKLIERSDRAKINNDISALMSGKIFADMGVAVLRGYESQYVNVLRNISTVRRVISRDVDNSAYLVEVETQRQEGPKGADVYGTYRDISYVVIEQNGQEFVITDWLTMTRKMQTEPEINPDSAVAKRLVALNLAGEISDEAKTEVSGLLTELYAACDNRVLHGPKDITVNGQAVTIQRGMYDCFNNDPEMLSSTKLEDINSRIRGQLVKHGTSVKANVDGVVTEWIGGADNQVEFTTEELISYQGRGDGIYQQCYYLVSKMYDTWVIDDIQILEQEEVSGEAFNTYYNRLAK